MRQAQLVVIRLADTPAVFWELAQARDIVEARRLLLMVPSSEPDAYDTCRAYAAKMLDARLPPVEFRDTFGQYLVAFLTRRRRFRDYFSFRGFIRFDDALQGEYLEGRFGVRAFLHSPLNRYGRASMLYCLKPVFDRLDAPWSEPRLNWGTFAVFALFVGGAIWGLATRLIG